MSDTAAPPLCPEHDRRAAMADEEFWDHVARNLGATMPDDLDGPDDDPDALPVGDPCPECGEVGACAYDSEGRPLIHATSDQED